jgi:hypothetical protein
MRHAASGISEHSKQFEFNFKEKWPAIKSDDFCRWQSVEFPTVSKLTERMSEKSAVSLKKDTNIKTKFHSKKLI